eukprot:5463700-Prymnesium_polylepis.2
MERLRHAMRLMCRAPNTLHKGHTRPTNRCTSTHAYATWTYMVGAVPDARAHRRHAIIWGDLFGCFGAMCGAPAGCCLSAVCRSKLAADYGRRGRTNATWRWPVLTCARR